MIPKYLKKFFQVLIAIELLLSSIATGQTSQYLQRTLTEIRTVPSSYVSFRKSYIITNEGAIDTNYQKILNQDSLAIPFLVGKLTDTAKTNIFSSCINSFLSRGDVAFFLLHNINHIIIDYSTDCEWDVLGNCGRFPQGFFEYFQKDRSKFQRKCSSVVFVIYPSLR
jgi:hypothetical protein